MASHHVHRQQLAGIYHVLTIGPQRGARALPGITTVEQQRTGAAGLHALDQRGQMREAANLAIAFGRLFIVQVTQGVGFRRTGAHLGGLEQVLAHQVRQVTAHRTQADVDAGFAEINGLELRMAIGHVQEGHIAELGNVVQAIGCNACFGIRIGTQAHTGHGARTQHLKKFTFSQIHKLVTTDLNVAKKARQLAGPL